MTYGDWTAIYAAIVATGALVLEVRRWFESGPKVFVRASIGLDRDKREVFVTVTNRGDTVTTVTHFTVNQYSGFWDRLRDRFDFDRSYPVFHPSGKPLPNVLAPGTHWTGWADAVPVYVGDLETGAVWVAIHTTDRDRPYLARIPKHRR
ncbi:conserved protein of unknown function [Candidatus Filomicrobium marinum]|uniref:Uncharacterized protein n=1 Tax=Candidatus Filomicrobium marinum TaxID=1608628 RepID=A0A0D6JJI1_9HYPH|nr:hypothetical protein [Candidatus Filomicrobium marinum]CFX34395.1 conserved protein of unknown function [Candidatus Filomicrobium marinum]CPR21862.1 conserved protein of unknown function [Candidatus Filomicrobium marinum]